MRRGSRGLAAAYGLGKYGKETRAAIAARKRREEAVAKSRERGFDLRLKGEGGRVSPLDAYDSLFDPALEGYFANPRIHGFLLDNGLIDREGKVIDVEANKAKLFIMEQELRNAEKAQWLALREEAQAEKRKAKAAAEAAALEAKARAVRERVLERRARRLEQKAARERIAPTSFRPFTPPGRPEMGGSGRGGGGGRTRRRTSEAEKSPEVLDAELDQALLRIEEYNARSSGHS